MASFMQCSRAGGETSGVGGGRVIKFPRLGSGRKPIRGAHLAPVPRARLAVNLPNLITLSRVPTLFGVVALLFWPAHGAASAAFVLFVVGGITDWLDGYLARRRGIVSNFGKLMDALTDKVMVVGVMVAMLVPTPGGPALLPNWTLFLVLVIFAREFLVTGLRLVAASQGLVLAAERTGKIKTVLQIVSVSVILLAHALQADTAHGHSALVVWDTGLGLFIVAAALTALSGAGYLLRYWGTFVGQADEARRPGAEKS
jgi:CDP-diacylglycerol---glycerol-3-phosphate 3-phosphatidyltransferase